MSFPSRRDTRIPALDGIRGLAISLVLCWHTLIHPLRGHLPNHPLLSLVVDLGRFSWSGVDLFFVLSGFLIGGILLDETRSPSYFSTFYIRRAYRIIPLYVVIVLLTLVVYGTNQWAWPRVAAELSFFLLFIQNFRVAATGAYAFAGLSMTWSLAVEEQFYLTLPLAVRLISRRILWRLLLGVVIAAPLLRILAVQVMKMPWIASYILTPCRSDSLCLGVLIAMAIRTPSVWGKIVIHRKYVYAAFALACVIGIWMLIGPFQPFTMQLFGLEYSLLAIVYSLLLLATLVSQSLSSLFSLTPLRFLGSIAYGLYLFHGMVSLVAFRVFAYLRPSSSGLVSLLPWLVTLPASVGLAAISWNYFEKPLVKRGHRYRYSESADSKDRKDRIESSPEIEPLGKERLAENF